MRLLQRQLDARYPAWQDTAMSALFQGRINGADSWMLTAPCCPATKLNWPLMSSGCAGAQQTMRLHLFSQQPLKRPPVRWLNVLIMPFTQSAGKRVPAPCAKVLGRAGPSSKPKVADGGPTGLFTECWPATDSACFTLVW